MCGIGSRVSDWELTKDDLIPAVAEDDLIPAVGVG
jgi:hypothetical protein